MAYFNDQHSTELSELPVGLSILARLWFGALGLGCLAAVPGLWMAETGLAVPEMALIKLGLSVFLGGAGLAAMGCAARAR
ncbi:hypothetical protein FIU97_08025 [Roseivivax sp. THAF40]|uniref:hypothetical protein n=1 Tax=unclassified Roseivivax TaxID=2639302 RepID=UPI001268B2BD|nr:MULTISPECIES: hypothetical protein [unclassified Roseivivax]QFS82744.1 hypothetical protein FIV09_07920 [Roseivivax sp. THAF197b]QFT46513.1 hypothetical protein FIU97_08025 [Roseivivax sp. THAF40]